MPNKKNSESFLPGLSAPARRALQNEGISSLKQLARYAKNEILALHGIGPSAIPKIEAALTEAGLRFRG